MNRELAVDFASRIWTDVRFIDRYDASELVELNQEIGNDNNPQRSTEIAHTANADLVATAAR